MLKSQHLIKLLGAGFSGVEVFSVRDLACKFNSSEFIKIISFKKKKKKRFRKMSDPRVAYITSLTEIPSWQEMLLLAQLT